MGRVQGMEAPPAAWGQITHFSEGKPFVAHSHFDTFLREATCPEASPSDHTINRDQLYGLYLSWCVIAGHSPATESVFWEAMELRIDCRLISLRMIGPAAADYILTAYPDLV
jgi:hypothetical protein